MLKTDIIDWLEDYKKKNNVKGVVLGLSGGKDSTVVAMLAKKVWGDKVVAVMMPNDVQADIEDSIEIARQLGLRKMNIDIGDITAAIKDAVFPIDISEKAKTNIPPRVRMTILYTIAQTLGYQVIGTGNYSEAYIGWTTKWGDSACDFAPIGNLTKTEVVELGLELAYEMNLDNKFIVKAPGDGLTGKTDEDNFGFTYEDLDGMLMETKDVDVEVEKKIMAMHFNSLHKNTPIPKFEKQ